MYLSADNSRVLSTSLSPLRYIYRLTILFLFELEKDLIVDAKNVFLNTVDSRNFELPGNCKKKPQKKTITLDIDTSSYPLVFF